MENKLEFEFKLPEDLNSQKPQFTESEELWLKTWVNIINSTKQDVPIEDVWQELDFLPGYRFKNLAILNVEPSELNYDESAKHEISIDFTYDDKEKIQ